MSARTPKGAYWGEINVTPERENAWRAWVTEYAVAVGLQWIESGSTRDEVEGGLGSIFADFDQIEGLPWMTLGRALMWRMSAVLRGGREYGGEDRIDYMLALRTAETASEEDMILASAYHFGITVQQAQNMVREARRDRLAERGPGRCALYRHFDAAGVLLYIGIAKSPAERTAQHERSSKWFPFVADTTEEWFETRKAALAAERDAIRNERPVFNDTHNKANRDGAIDYLLTAALKAVAS